MGIVLGLLAAVFWGSGDFLTRGVTRTIGTYRTLFYMQSTGLIGVTIFMLVTGEFARLASPALSAWAVLVGATLINTVGTFGLYRALQTGVLAVVSPIAASYSAVTVVLAVLSGETLTVTHLLGIVIVIIGGVLAALEQPPTPPAFFSDAADVKQGFRLPRGVPSALLASAGYGTFFWIFGTFVTPIFGGIFPVWFVRLVTPILLLVLALPLRRSMRPPVGRMWLPVIGIGMLDTAAFISSTVGMTTEQVSIVTVLSALFSAVTVLLAWIFLREPLRRIQWGGIGLIFVGIVLVSI
jgi:drug/metabolite transporter (DMT)-like permease